MVIFGGLEVLAAGYLIHQHHENKKERLRAEEEEEEYERRRAERHARRRERRGERRDERREKKRSESAPPSPHEKPRREKYTYSPPPPMKAQSVARPQAAPQWVPPGPPPPIQYTPQQPVTIGSPRLPPRPVHGASPPVVPIAPPRIPPPPLARPSPPPAAASTMSLPQHATPPTYGTPPTTYTHHNTPQYTAPLPTPQPYSLPMSAYEMSGGEVPQQYLYSSIHTPELRADSPPLGERHERSGARPILRTGERRARSNSRVRFALPVDGDEGRLMEVTPGDTPSEMPTSPPPPYRP